MAKLIVIAAIGKNRELGYNNHLIWKIKEDMKFFKENTIGHKIVMGYNTFLSLPSSLEKREYIVLTHKNIKIDNGQVVHNFQELLDYLQGLDEDVFIIGGSQIYQLFIKYADELLLTQIDEEEKRADVYFPEFREEDYQKEIIKESIENNIKYSFVRYRRV